MKIRTEEELLQLRTLNEGAITSSVGEYGSPEFSEVIDQLLVARMALKHIADTAGHQYSTSGVRDVLECHPCDE